jgi:cobalt-zinc-cadmium efflux system outer membrane protein
MHKLGYMTLCALYPVILTAWSGCATVNPRPDYDRTAVCVESTTGKRLEYRPDCDEPEIEARITELLEGGLTADEAAEIALLNNRRIQALLFDVGVARADFVQAGLLSNPTFAIDARLPDGGGLADIQAAFAQNLADLWQIPARKRAAERALERTILQVARDISVIAFDAKNAYYAARQAERKLQIARESIQIAQQVLDNALARQQAGAGGEVDVNLARSALQDVELTLRSAELQAFEARSALTTLLSLSIAPDTLELVEDLPQPPTWTIPHEELLALAAEHRLDVHAAVQAAEAACARIRQEQLRVFPVLEVGVAMEREARWASEGRDILADSLRASIEAGEPAVDIAEKESGGGEDVITGPALSMELPIFNQNQGGIARARFEYAQSRKVLDSLIVQVSQEVRLASARAKTAWETAAYYRDDVIPLREQSLELAATAYKAGRTPVLTVLEQQRALLAAWAGYADSLEASATAVVELERATGQPISCLLRPSEGLDQNEVTGTRGSSE